MQGIDILVLAIIAAILGLVIFYICRAKKKGVKCIGCPSGSQCGGNCAACGGCSTCGSCGSCPSAQSKSNP